MNELMGIQGRVTNWRVVEVEHQGNSRMQLWCQFLSHDSEVKANFCLADHIMTSEVVDEQDSEGVRESDGGEVQDD